MRVIDNALFSKFTADAGAGGLNTLVSGWFRHQAPDGQAFPYGIYQQIAGVDVYVYPGRAYRRITYLCKAVDSSANSSAAAAVAERLDAQLTDQPLTVTGHTVIYCRRVGDIEFIEVDGDQKYQHIGGEWQILIQQT